MLGREDLAYLAGGGGNGAPVRPGPPYGMVAVKSKPQFLQPVRPFFTSCPQRGHMRPRGRLISQISERKTKPINPTTMTSATPIPVPTLQASLLATVSHLLLAVPATTQTTIRKHHRTKAQVAFRQRGRSAILASLSDR